jgi:hypothetical protein
MEIALANASSATKPVNLVPFLKGSKVEFINISLPTNEGRPDANDLPVRWRKHPSD